MNELSKRWAIIFGIVSLVIAMFSGYSAIREYSVRTYGHQIEVVVDSVRFFKGKNGGYKIGFEYQGRSYENVKYAVPGHIHSGDTVALLHLQAYDDYFLIPGRAPQWFESILFCLLMLGICAGMIYVFFKAPAPTFRHGLGIPVDKFGNALPRK
jgi:hypothetical protein